jgi:N-acetyl-gamma-glutamyl-phosphate reductase
VLSVGIIGASGYTGAELLRLCAAHPELRVELATGDTQAGTAVAELYPSLAGAYPDLRFEPVDPERAAGLDLVFLGLPHGASQDLVPSLRPRAKRIVDLAADFRLKDPSLYPQWYGEAHRCPELLGEFVYGLPELFRAQHEGATLVASPGCYVTTAALTLAPLVHGGLVEPAGIIVDAASGVSGAGRALKANTAFCTVDEDFTAYGLLNHRHTPEIEMAISASAPTGPAGATSDPPAVSVLFTPHLAPMNRGILATCYARPAVTGLTTATLLEHLTDVYREEPFVVVSERSPSTKATLGSNSFHLTARVDQRTGWVVAIGALDNLIKGASGQAIQSANLLCGLPETTGLPVAGLFP